MNTRELEHLRREIRRLDERLVTLLAERVSLARQVGAVKRQTGINTMDPAREAAVIRHAGALAREYDLDDEEVRQIFWHLIGLCRRAQQREAAEC